MKSLGNSPVFNLVNLSYSEEVVMENQKMRRFGVDLILNQDIDLEKITPLMVRRGELKVDPMASKVQIDKDGKVTTPEAGAHPPAANVPVIKPAAAH
jgi:hypothetical protein